jgi:TolB-like protein/class 3 adenylate cyclase/Flp pilus assembly protein TadD
MRRLAAILAADVVGYSRLMGEDEAGTLAALRAHRAEVFGPVIAERGGRLVKLMGDGALVEFASVVEAVEAALAIQQRIAAAGGCIRLRIGINLGDVIIDGDDIYGDGVNVAARLEALAEPGGICISSIVHESIGNRIETGFADAGEHEVKGITRAIRVWRWPDKHTTRTDQSPLALPEKPSIAVLPFNNMSSDPEQEFFVDGIVEDIITELSRFSELFVIARNSSFAYKGRSVDIKQVAQELGVRYVLEGSVRRAGNRVRITAQLLDRDTGSHVWGEKYDRDLEDIFALQEEITRHVVSSIAPQIELAEQERSRRLTGANLSAYELALKAQALFYDGIRAGEPAMVDQAIMTAEAALALDVRSTQALWAKGMAFVFQHLYRWGDDPDRTLALAGDVADRFISIDTSNAKAFVLRAWVNQFRRDFDAALADYRRAFDLNPNFAINLFTMAWGESVMGMTVEAKEHAQLALRLSPRDTDIWLGEGYLALTQAYFADGDFEECRKWARLAIQLTAKAPIRQTLMIASCGHLGDLDAARPHIDALTFAPDFLPDVLSGVTELYRMPEHNALLLDGLHKAGLPE